MSYLIVGVCLVLVIKIYITLGNKYQIVDTPTQRGSHKRATIRGGGIIFPVSIIIWFSFFDHQYVYFITGLVIISIISFFDDILTLSALQRIAIHFISVSLLFLEIGLFAGFSYELLFIYILILGWINAVNFMDGINGITAQYFIVLMSTLAYINYSQQFIDPAALHIMLIALLVFAWFNNRRSALVFAGDVGSISVAFISAFFLMLLMLKELRWEYIMLVSLYGVDTSLTILERLSRKENIFKPHRQHLYQLITNEIGISHTMTSSIYAITQVIINIIFLTLVQSSHNSALMTLAFLLILGVIYLLVKTIVKKKINTNEY